jgi:hypothetical protein
VNQWPRGIFSTQHWSTAAPRQPRQCIPKESTIDALAPQYANGRVHHIEGKMASLIGDILPVIALRQTPTTVTCDLRQKDCSGEQLPRVRPPASSGFPPATPAAHQRSPQAHNRPQYALPLSFGHGGNLLRDRGGLHGVSPHLGYN